MVGGLGPTRTSIDLCLKLRTSICAVIAMMNRKTYLMVTSSEIISSLDVIMGLRSLAEAKCDARVDKHRLRRGKNPSTLSSAKVEEIDPQVGRLNKSSGRSDVCLDFLNGLMVISIWDGAKGKKT